MINKDTVIPTWRLLGRNGVGKELTIRRHPQTKEHSGRSRHESNLKASSMAADMSATKKLAMIKILHRKSVNKRHSRFFTPSL